jgi:hypothetical protein
MPLRTVHYVVRTISVFTSCFKICLGHLKVHSLALWHRQKYSSLNVQPFSFHTLCVWGKFHVYFISQKAQSKNTGGRLDSGMMVGCIREFHTITWISAMATELLLVCGAMALGNHCLAHISKECCGASAGTWCFCNLLYVWIRNCGLSRVNPAGIVGAYCDCHFPLHHDGGVIFGKSY